MCGGTAGPSKAQKRRDTLHSDAPQLSEYGAVWYPATREHYDFLRGTQVQLRSKANGYERTLQLDSKQVGEVAFRFVLRVGIVNLFADMSMKVREA